MKDRPVIIWEGSIVLTDKTKNNVNLYEIRPTNIPISDGKYAGHFGKCETEEAAGNLIKFFQKQSRWVSFKISDLREFLGKEKTKRLELLYGLHGKFYDDYQVRVAPLYIVRVEKNYFITDLFINQCMKKSEK
ncbi:MAG: hypothetical protein WC849_00790 [Candidatus Paceibacterota bacterium]